MKNFKKSILFFLFVFLLSSCNEEENQPDNSIQFNPDVTYGTVTDVEGNTYKTVTIGSQTWMAENLRTTKYANGDTIAHFKSNADWQNTMQGAYCDYDNKPSNSLIFGKLYNGYVALDDRKIAPEGWHVPSLSEWNTLFTYLGGIQDAANKMKEIGATHWTTTTSWDEVTYTNNSTNESGFTALGSGIRFNSAVFMYLDLSGYFWTSTMSEGFPSNAYHIRLDGMEGFKVSRYFGSGDYSFLNYGISIRCIKD